MKFRVKSQYLLLFIGFSNMAIGSPAMAGTLHLNGTWNYTDSDSKDSGDFTHRYTGSYTGKTDITELIRLNGNVRYSKNITEDNTVDTLTPNLSINNQNDIYNLNLTGKYNISRDDDRQREDWDWNSFLSSNWEQRVFLPSLSVFYGQSKRFDDDSDGVKSDRAGSTVLWNYLEWLGLRYSINWNESDDKDTGSNTEITTQTAQLDASQSFFDNRVGLSFSQSYQKNDQDFFTPFKEGEFSLAPVVVSQALYEETNDPLSGPLTNDASFLLSDSDQPPTTLEIDPANEPMNLGIQVDLKQVDVIYLATFDDIESYADNFIWDLYGSSNGLDWELQETGLLFVYNAEEQRFEFDLEKQVHRYLKLVADTSGLTPLQVTEIVAIEVFRKFSGDSFSNNRTTYQSNFNLFYQVSNTLNFNYTFNYVDANDDVNVDTEDISNQGSFSWTPSRYFAARLNASRSDNKTESEPDSINRIYTLSVSSNPLPTLSLTLGASRNESEPGDAPDKTVHGYSFYTTAQLYEDLWGSMNLNYTTIEEGVGDDSFSGNLRLTARLRPTLLFNYDSRYNRNLDADNYTFDNIATLNWRLSYMLNINSGFDVRTGTDMDTETGLQVTMNVTPSYKHRLSTTYALRDDGDDVTHLYSANWHYVITRVFNFQLNGNYFDGEDGSSWSFFARLNAQYRNDR